MSRRDYQIVGMVALIVAWIWQLTVNVGGLGLGLVNTGYLDDLRWVLGLQLMGWFVLPVGYAACISGSPRGLRLATIVVALLTGAALASGLAYEWAWIAHIGETEPVWSLALSAAGLIIGLDAPGLLLLVGVWRMKRSNLQAVG